MCVSLVRRRLVSPMLLGVVHFMAALTLQAQAAPAPLAPGLWRVGFSYAVRTDSSRMSSAGRPRALDLAVWYPTRDTSAARLTWAHYFLLAPEPGGESSNRTTGLRELAEFVAFLEGHGAAASAVGRWIHAPMLATMDAPASDARFPLVLLAQGNGQTVSDQAALAELLASHGYVVATVSSPMRISGPLTDEEQTGRFATDQALDLVFVRGAAAARPDVAPGRVGVVGHSFGARGALLLAMREPGVAAVVSLDGGIGTATGRTSLEAVAFWDRDAVKAPILHFYERLDAFMSPDFGLLRGLSMSDRWLVETPAMRHHHFTALGAASVAFPALRAAVAATDATAEQYRSVAQATREFLDAFVKGVPEVRLRLESGTGWPHLGRPTRLRGGTSAGSSTGRDPGRVGGNRRR